MLRVEQVVLGARVQLPEIPPILTLYYLREDAHARETNIAKNRLKIQSSEQTPKKRESELKGPSPLKGLHDNLVAL